MTIFRWTMAALVGLSAVSWLVSFAVALAFENEIWDGRARVMKHLLYIAALLWFNVEVWGRVVLTLVNWAR